MHFFSARLFAQVNAIKSKHKKYIKQHSPVVVSFFLFDVYSIQRIRIQSYNFFDLISSSFHSTVNT